MKLQKNGIIKEIADERLVADYISAGWEKVEEKAKEKSKFDKIKEL